MSQVGKEKKFERLAKMAKRHLLTPYDAKSDHDKKLWDKGTRKLLGDLRKGKDGGC